MDGLIRLIRSTIHRNILRYILTRRFSLWILGVVLGTRLAFEQTHSDRAHHFREVTHHGPLNSSVCNDYLIAGLCCGVLFLRPESTSQLAAACVISLAFFSLHAEIRPYTEHNEDQLQFCAMLSITLTLLGGILLKTNTHKEDPNGAVVMAVTLVTINAGVITLFIRHCYLTWRFPSPEVTSSGYVFIITPYLLHQAFCQSLSAKTVHVPYAYRRTSWSPCQNSLSTQKVLWKIAKRGIKKLKPLLKGAIRSLGLNQEAQDATEAGLLPLVDMIPEVWLFHIFAASSHVP